MADRSRSPDAQSTATPRWVKAFGAVAVVVVVLFVVLLLLGGGHGPGRHSGEAAGLERHV